MSIVVPLIGLQEHCWQLAQVLAELWQHDPVTLEEGGESWEFGDAAAWLNMAAGVSKVEVNTARYDESVMWCSTAAEYEDARSELYSRLAAETTVFMFVWGAFETVARIVGPPSIPPDQRTNGANGLVDRVLFQLRDFAPFDEYNQVLQELSLLVSRDLNYIRLARQEPKPPHIGVSGAGLDLVRRVRNKFAHGSSNLPMPESTKQGRCGKTSDVPRLISISSRIVLFTMQMLLASYYAQHHFELHVLKDEDDFTVGADVHLVLRELHRTATGEAT
jgi:hypothetical protein